MGILARAALAPEVRITASSGDWRGVSEGFRRSGKEDVLSSAGSRAVVHFHDLDSSPAEVSVTVSPRDRSVPVALVVRTDGQVYGGGELPDQPTAVTVGVPPGGSGIDLLLEATTPAPTTRPLYLIHEVRLRRRPSWTLRTREVLPLLAGLASLALLRRRGSLGRAVSWSLLLTGLVASACMVLGDPASLLRFKPVEREALQVIGLASLWALALASAPSPRTAIAALVGTVLVLHLPTLRAGLASDDFLWVRPWSWSQLASTLVGSEDPTGISNAYYRPTASWSHALDYQLWGPRPWGSHVTNLVLHAANAVVAWGLLLRLGLSPRGALAGAAAWSAHPMAAPAVAWASQRTDELTTVGYLGALAALTAPVFDRTRAVLTAVCVGLALASKETAVTLPLAAALLVPLGVPMEQRRARWRAVRMIALAVMAYVGFWVTLFPGKFVKRTGLAEGWGLGVKRALSWLLKLPDLYAPIFAPPAYEDWFNDRTWRASGLGLAVFLLLAVPALVWMARSRASRAPFQVALLGLAWPLLTIWPLLALEDLDLYRLGLLLSFAFGLVVGAVATHLDTGSRVPVAALAAALAVCLAPRAVESAAAFAPDGFWAERTATAIRRSPRWLGALTPDMSRQFRELLARQEHVSKWIDEHALEAGESGP